MCNFVVCPGCRKRFQVDDKFAGKTGLCPNCKGKIRVPTKAEEVKIHAPGEGPADGSPGSQLVIKPLERLETPWSPVAAATIGGAIVVVVLTAWLGGRADVFDGLLARALALLVISPPLVAAGYTFLRESEDLDPYHGKALWLRSGICSLVYILLWWIYGYIADVALTGELWNWFFVVPPFFLIGGLAALSCLDLEYTSGIFHYGFYVLATVILRAIAGQGWAWQVSNDLTNLGTF